MASHRELLKTWWTTTRGRSRLTEGHVLSQLLGLSTPIAWGLFVVLGCNLVDALLVSQLGPEPMAAYTLTFPMALVASNFGSAGGVALTTLVGREVGQHDWEGARRLATDSLMTLSLVGLLLAGLTLFFQPQLVALLTSNSQEQALLSSFLPLYLPSLVLLLVGIVGGSAIRAIGDTFWPSLLMSLSAVINIVLDWLLIPGHPGWGLPSLGLNGVGWAALVSRGLVAIITVALLIKTRLFYPNLRLRWAERWHHLRELVSIGLPSLLGQLMLPVSISFVTQLIQAYGPTTVAAYGLAYRVESFALIGLIALSTALLPFMAQNAGAGYCERVKEGIRSTVLLVLGYGLLIGLTFSLFAQPFVSFLHPDPKLIPWAASYLSLVPVSYWGIGLTMAWMNLLYAQRKPWKGMGVALLRLFVLLIPLSWLGHWASGKLASWFQPELSENAMGLLGVLAGLTLANSLAGTFALLGLWRYNQNAANEAKLSVSASDTCSV